MTDDFIIENCAKCRDCWQIGVHMHGCYYEPYKGKWIAEIEKCPKYELDKEYYYIKEKH